MPTRSRILTAGLLLSILITWVVLIAVDSTRDLTDPTAPRANTIPHAIILTGLAVVTLLAGGTCGVLFLWHTIASARASVEHCLDALAEGQADLVARFDESQADLAAHFDQLAATMGETTREMPRLIAVPAGHAVGRATPTLYGTAPPAGTTKTRQRRRTSSRRPPKESAVPDTETTPGDHVPPAYLEDMSKAVDLGRQLEAKRRHRGPADT